MVEEIYKKGRNGKKDTLLGERIVVNGKEAKLRFTVPIWFRVEDEICTSDDLYTMMHSKDRFHREKLPRLIEIMTDGEITADDFLRERDPATIKALINKCQDVIVKAMSMREKKYDDDSVHDEVLEEIEKKEAKAD